MHCSTYSNGEYLFSLQTNTNNEFSYIAVLNGEEWEHRIPVKSFDRLGQLKFSKYVNKQK